MRKHIATVLFLLCAAHSVDAQTATERLKQVKTIFVAPLGGQNPDIAEMIHAKLIGALSKQLQDVTVTEDADSADAVLTGSGLTQSGTDRYGRPQYHIQAGMRLVSKQGSIVLWADNVSNGRFATSASSSFAENVAKSLARVFSEAKKK
jgi:hypothetical protein